MSVKQGEKGQPLQLVTASQLSVVSHLSLSIFFFLRFVPDFQTSKLLVTRGLVVRGPSGVRQTLTLRPRIVWEGGRTVAGSDGQITPDDG